MREEAKVLKYEEKTMAMVARRFTAEDMRGAFTEGAAYGRAHQFMPAEMNPVKAAEEALANWPD